MSHRLHVACPDCGCDLTIDAATGEIVAHRAAKRPPAGGKDFDALLKGLDEGRARAEALFEQEKAAHRDRQRILEEKFTEAMRRAEEDDGDTPPPRPFDFD